MDFTVSLPSSTERDVLVEAFSASVEADSDYSSLRAEMARLILNGKSPHSIHCMLLRTSTIRLVKGRLKSFGNPLHIAIAFGTPISLN